MREAGRDFRSERPRTDQGNIEPVGSQLAYRSRGRMGWKAVQKMSKNEANWKENRREDWATPAKIFDPLNEVFSFAIDLCASHENAKVPTYIAEVTNLLTVSPDEIRLRIGIQQGGYAWINPPYQTHGGTGKFIKKAAELCTECGMGLVALIPVSTGTKWYRESVFQNFDAVIFPPRFGFEGAGQNATFDCAIWVKWSPQHRGSKWRIMDLQAANLGQIMEIYR